MRILDVNDNHPTFLFDPHPITISESTAPNTVILTIIAMDRDIGINAELTFTITAGNTSGTTVIG